MNINQMSGRLMERRLCLISGVGDVGACVRCWKVYRGIESGE